MKSVRKRMVSFLITCLLGIILSAETAYAFQPYQVYTYNGNEEAVPAVPAYQIEKIVDGAQAGFGRLDAPQDMFVDSEDNIYILDSGNCRILILNNQYELIRELKDFFYQNNVTNLAKDAKGIFYKENSELLYIADTQNDRVLVSDLYGNIYKIYEKPVSQLLDVNVAYKPRKIIVDNMDIMYVTSANVNTGALMIDANNNFLGFYGTNKIKQTLKIKTENFLRSIMTEKQQSYLTVSFQPTEFNNLFWSEDRFIYAVSPINDNLDLSVAKLNVVGDNTFSKNNTYSENLFFGDLVSGVQMDLSNCSFEDITVDDEGFFSIVDIVNGKIFQYDDKCNLICVCGGDGWQKGLFKKVIAIESNSKNELLVLDGTKGNVTVLELTYYGEQVREAVKLYNKGQYLDALEGWIEVLRMNPNFNLGYIGMGKAYMNIGEYKQAMECFQIGEDQENYGKAKAELREEWIRNNFGFLAIIIVALLISVLCYDKLKKFLVAISQYFGRKKGVEK